MSMHKIPLSDHEKAGLEKHGLPVGSPSQASDCFRLGMAHAAAPLLERIAALTAQVEQAEPQSGNWIAADDYRVNVKALDVALNGEGGAERPALIDILAQVEQVARKFGMPVLTALEASLQQDQVEQAAQPVAWLYSTDQGKGKPWASTQPPSSHDQQGLADAEMLVRPLYIAPPPLVAITDEQPFGYWHVGATEDESDFFLHSESGDVSCENCVKLYTAPPKAVPLTDEQIEAAAKVLSHCMDYPWEHMPESGRLNMRKNARTVIEAAIGTPATVEKGGE